MILFYQKRIKNQYTILLLTLPDTSGNQPSYAWVWAAVAMALLALGLVVRRS
ncbi:MAG: LPXTG cell wall anchor domain-containing protein [Chloroflexi bacterium]|nr:LPXTG cell wall anchor domain-containing protein [Chloroflexota bacterium]